MASKTQYTKHSSVVNKILKESPSFSIKWGTSIIFIILVSAVIFSSYLYVPHYLTTNIRITNNSQNINNLLSKTDYPDSLLVSKGQTIARITPTHNTPQKTVRIHSPVDGVLHYQINQTPLKETKSNSKLFHIKPGNNLLLGKLPNNIPGIRKIKTGQKIEIHTTISHKKTCIHGEVLNLFFFGRNSVVLLIKYNSKKIKLKPEWVINGQLKIALKDDSLLDVFTANK